MEREIKLPSALNINTIKGTDHFFVHVCYQKDDWQVWCKSNLRRRKDPALSQCGGFYCLTLGKRVKKRSKWECLKTGSVQFNQPISFSENIKKNCIVQKLRWYPRFSQCQKRMCRDYKEKEKLYSSKAKMVSPVNAKKGCVGMRVANEDIFWLSWDDAKTNNSYDLIMCLISIHYLSLNTRSFLRGLKQSSILHGHGWCWIKLRMVPV